VINGKVDVGRRVISPPGGNALIARVQHQSPMTTCRQLVALHDSMSPSQG